MPSSPEQPTPAIGGIVRVWHQDGWGVIDSPETPGGCWAHFSDLDVPGFKELLDGHSVTFTFEPANQDGYSYRALHVWSQGPEPQPWPGPSEGPGAAYRSILTITWDES